ncbi:MAG: magnesium transporter CorA family protein [Bacteroidaceae bacterium]|nr:magnesium transporter CorA family protein [Bacteroidaceae bacterium]MBR3531645.1 magnesium transporter CorA family protein [Bacteroidaceae bacterium]
MRSFWNTKKGVTPIDEWQPGCWVQITCPVEDDVRFLVNELHMPDYFITDVADADERARYDMDEGWLMIILRIPHLKSVNSRTPYTTIPLGVVLKGDVVVTICDQEARMMVDFVNHQQRRAEGFSDAADLVFRLFLSASVWYLKYLKQVNGLIEKAKRNLGGQIDNEDLVSLSRLQDSLTYFATSIRGNETLLSKLKFRLPVDELDAELIEDVNIEMNQARETTQIYSNILDSTMDTYANVINNNMNKVMRLLTSLNMIIMFPTLIASLFGMNLINGMESYRFGFVIAIVISFISTILGLLWFKRKKWL